MARQRKYRRFTNANSRRIFLEALSRGMPVVTACRMAHWYQHDVYQWRKHDEQFAQEWEEAIEAGIALLEQEALRRATIGREVPIFDLNGQQTGSTRTAPSDVLLIFLLKAKKPDVYRETYRHDITNSDNSLVAFANAMNMLEDPRYVASLPAPIDVTEFTNVADAEAIDTDRTSQPD